MMMLMLSYVKRPVLTRPGLTIARLCWHLLIVICAFHLVIVRGYLRE